MAGRRSEDIPRRPGSLTLSLQLSKLYIGNEIVNADLLALVFGNGTISTLAHCYKNSTPTPKLRPFLLSSLALITSGSEKLISNRAMGCA